MSYNKGLIFKADKQYRKPKEAYHPIIYWGNTDTDYFLGLMISHSEKFNNIKLNSPEYFDWVSDNFSKTNFVQALLLKPVDWLVNKTDIGQLSEIGIDYVENVIQQCQPITWDDYLAISMS